jgi:Holliday junction DNA helicase RuvA
MIARLRGKPVANTPDGLVVDVGGIGYLVAATPSAIRAADGAAEVALHTYLHVREDALQLYGFVEAAERELFLQLLSVNGIGPKVALAIVSGSPAADLRRAIVLGDTARFQAIPGIGKKTAERIVLELKEKIGEAPVPITSAGGSDSGSQPHLVARDASSSSATARRGGAGPARVDPELPPEERVREALKRPRHVHPVLAPAVASEDEDLEQSLRPRRPAEFVGQGADQGAARHLADGRRRATSRSTTCSSSGRPGSARRAARSSCARNSASAYVASLVPRSSARATWRRSSPASSVTTSSSSTRSTG